MEEREEAGAVAVGVVAEAGEEEGLADLVASVAVGGLAAVVPVAIGDQGAFHGEDDAKRTRRAVAPRG